VVDLRGKQDEPKHQETLPTIKKDIPNFEAQDPLEEINLA